jgi:formylglycine-generating enzyme required for sulfatase activity
MKSFLQTLPDSKCRFEMILVEGGVFDMGGESWLDNALPVHKVALSDYWMAVHPVTQGLWEAVTGEGKNGSYFKGKRRPVESVSWEEVHDGFLPALNAMTLDNRPAGTLYKLPTEAQWEYAARGGARGAGFLYSGGNTLDDVGWHEENSHGETKPIGLKLPNELGLHDMSGNVWEWCNDWYGRDYYKKCSKQGVAQDPVGPVEGDYRVVRGGSWVNNPRYCRVSSRNYDPPHYRFSLVGFRLVLVSLPVQGSKSGLL